MFLYKGKFYKSNENSKVFVIMTGVSFNAINATSATKVETTKGQKTNAHLLNQPITDTVEISSKKSDKKYNVYTATKRYAELTEGKDYAGTINNLKFAKYYAQDKIDVPTVEKLVKTTEFDLDSMSDVYTTGKMLNDNKFVDKIAEKATEYDKKDQVKLAKQNIKKEDRCHSAQRFFGYNGDMTPKGTYGIIHTEGAKDHLGVYRENFDEKGNLVKTIDLSSHYTKEARKASLQILMNGVTEPYGKHVDLFPEDK